MSNPTDAETGEMRPHIPSPTLDAIRQRADAATPGPWIDGDPWLVAGVGFHHRGPDECNYCHLGPPVWAGRCDINGEVMQAHRHRSPDAYAPGHIITSADGYTVAGNYAETGGIVDPADTEFIRHAREDIPALVAALNAVLRLHGADSYGNCCECGGECGGEDDPQGAPWPCLTVRDIRTALNGEAIR